MMSTGLTLELGAEEESKNLIHVLIRMWITNLGRTIHLIKHFHKCETC